MKIPFVVLTLLFVFACASNEGPSKEVLAAGEKVYGTYCVACHGPDGTMAINGAKDLNLSVMPINERIEIITTGKNMMTGFETVLKEDEIKAVAEYTLAHFKKK